MLLVLARFLRRFPGLLLTLFPPLLALAIAIFSAAAMPLCFLLSLPFSRSLAPLVTRFPASASRALATPLAPALSPAVMPAGED